MLGSWGLTLRHPGWWAISLAAFLVRGGLVALVLPIVVLPTVAGLSTSAAPLVGEVALGGGPTSLIVPIVATMVALAAWIVGAGLLGAWLDVGQLEETLRELGPALPADGRGRSLRAALNARLTPHVLTAVVLAFAAVRIVDATYQELISPSGPELLLVRIVARAPDAVIAAIAGWLLAEAIGGLALRGYAVGGSSPLSVPAAVWLGIRGVLRPSGLLTLVVTSLVLAGLAVPVWLADAAAWNRVRDLLVDRAGGLELGLALAIMVLTWAVGLGLVAIGLAWRATAWTAESVRRGLGREA